MAHDTNPQGRRDQQQPFFWTKKDKRTEQKCAKNVLKWPRWSKGKGHNATLCFSWALCSLSKKEPIYLVYICITFSLEIMYVRGFTNFEITVACGLKFHWYLRTLSLKFQKARTKIEVLNLMSSNTPETVDFTPPWY